MKKAFDQTVRDIKREVNKKVLKVPSIEQKVLDATSNEPWGPHGSHLADIAQASRNYHEYQMIMSVIWKRINDTGKNWRHVYKALTVLEYLVGHGSERVIDEIREHAYQISTLSDFQYIDSSGRDQGTNVRKKSQSLVFLVNDKERIEEVRQKAASNRDKYRNTSGGGMYRPGSYSGSGGYGERYDDDRHEGRYGGRDEDRNGYDREKEWGGRDDDKSGRYGDPYSRDGDRYGREYEDRYTRDGYKDDDYRGRSQSVDDYHYGSRSRSSDRERDRAYGDDGQYSRGSNVRAEDRSQDGSFSGRPLERKFSEQNLGAPPSYEEATSDARSSVHSERDGETPIPPAPQSSSPQAGANPNHAFSVPTHAPSPPAPASPPTASPSPAPSSHQASNTTADGFDEFDPRGTFQAVPAPVPATSVGSEMDLLGSLSDSFSCNALAIIPVALPSNTSEADAPTSGSGSSLVATSSTSMFPTAAFDDPFGDGPFKAIPSNESTPAQAQNVPLSSSFLASDNQISEPHQIVPQEFGNAMPGATYTAGIASNMPTNQPYLHHELSSPSQDTDILADILPPSGPSSSVTQQPPFGTAMSQPSVTGLSSQISQPMPGAGFPSQIGQPVSHLSFQSQISQPVSLSGFPSQPGQSGSQTGYPAQTGQYLGQPPSQSSFLPQVSYGSGTSFHASNGQPTHTNANFFEPLASHTLTGPTPRASHAQTGPAGQNNSMNYFPQLGSAVSSQIAIQTPQSQSNTSLVSQSAHTVSTAPLTVVPQPAQDKFETKSAIWADTLSRGLVNLNISGPKTNPLADIGVDFDSINRKEKRMEKPTANSVTSNVSMGRAMGSGSGIGRAGATALRPPANPMMGPGMNVGFGGGNGMGVYGANAMGQNMGMGMNMNMGMGQGVGMQPPGGYTPGSATQGGYNPRMMGAGGYGQQYGGYR